jgi:ABC-type glutathione transport system ATPase component
MSNPATPVLKSPNEARKTATRLDAFRRQTQADLDSSQKQLDACENYLSISNHVTDALEILSDKLFRETLDLIQEKLSFALQEILEQPIQLIAQASWKNNAAAVDFHIERDGNSEDILRGQGGSVANILSIGLRLFALANLNPAEHRPFLVLDEQDCWLKPDLVPRLVRIVHEAGNALGFQVLMVSHHDREIFEQYADKIYRLSPGPNGTANVELVFEK